MRRAFSIACSFVIFLVLTGPGGSAEPPPPTPITPPTSELPKATFDAGHDLGIEAETCRGQFYGGAGVYFLAPFLAGAQAFTVKTTSSSPNPGSSSSTTLSSEHDFDPDMQVSPLIWLGYVGPSGLGIRGRWWHFDEETDDGAVNGDATGATTISSASSRGLSLTSPGHLLKGFGSGTDVLDFKSKLRMDIADLELTQSVQTGCWSFLVSAGARYAHVGQSYDAFRVNSGVSETTQFTEDSGTLISGHNFDGAGPTVSLEVRRPLGNTALALYANTRGSLLFGSEKQHAERLTVEAGTQAGSPFQNTTFLESSASGDAVLPVAEIELGAEYARDRNRFHPYVRTGVIAQTWFGAGNASGGNSNLGFLGLTLVAGVAY
jgi:hypothetical protein